MESQFLFFLAFLFLLHPLVVLFIVVFFSRI
jgi:hypothetical protein